jgi:membrane-associated protease RseP (regulator of RpoE activity)
MSEPQTSNKTITLVVVVVAVGLLLSLVAGALAGGVAGYLVGRQQGRLSAERALDEMAAGQAVPVPYEELPMPGMPPGIEDLPPGQNLPGPMPFDLGASGAVVRQVVEGTPAQEAGLQPGDIIVTVDGRSVIEAGDLRIALEDYEPGDRVDLGIWRQGEEISLLVRLAEHPDQPGTPYLGIFYNMLDLPRD